MRINRNFPADVQEIQKQWMGTAVDTDKWTPTGRTLGGVTQTFLVSRHDGLLAVAKPGVGGIAEHPQAQEKIASDLAHLLDIPIPPVALTKMQAPGSPTEYWVALSAYCFPQCVTYGAAKTALSATQQEYIDRLASVALAFDTWIGNSDRHTGNCVVHDHTENGWMGGALIDHGRTLSYTWRKTPEAFFLPAFIGSRKHKDLILGKAEQIQGLSDSAIRGIIERIPDEVLAAGQKHLVITELIRRKAPLRDFLLKET